MPQVVPAAPATGVRVRRNDACGIAGNACGSNGASTRPASTIVKSSPRDGKRHFEVMEDECVGCNLCAVVCPVPQCITLRDLQPGETDLRTGKVVSGAHADWTTHPNNPSRASA